MFASKDIFLKSSGGYQISRSVRLRSSASAYLNRTPAGAGSRTTWTLSYWVKLSNLGTNRTLLNVGGLASGYGLIFHNNSNQIDFQELGGSTARLTTSRVYRDPSAWYHIVCVWDSSNATASDRMRIYTNGIRETSFVTQINPALNAQSAINTASLTRIGWDTSSTSNWTFDGYLTEINFIDGQALTPSSFGETNSVTGVWQPIKYTGTYGTNGFYLNFSDNSGVTATTIGKDYSGNGNNWTPNNISITAGVTYDSMLDSPTPYADGGNGRGNYAVVNPLSLASSTTLSEANLKGVSSTFNNLQSGTVAVSSGKWYWELTFGGSLGMVGIVPASAPPTTDLGYTATSYGYRSSTGTKYNNGSATAYGNTYTTNDVIGVALDLDNGKLFFSKNNTWQNSGDPAAGTNAAFTGLSGSFMPAAGTPDTTAATWYWNFGQRPFTYTPPTGFVALNTQNLSTPTISNGATVMAATLYTGNATARTIDNSVNGVSFQPDWVWIKSRSATTNNQLVDAVRGTSLGLSSNLTSAEYGVGVNAFASNGFGLTTDGSLLGVNVNAATYVAWQWNAGGSTVTNTNGSISAQVRANATAGFSVVTYTGTGANATVGHGLGVAPKMIIVKNRSAVSSWMIAVDYSGFTWSSDYFQFDTGAKYTNGASTIFRQAPTSTVFSVGTNSNINGSTNNLVAYCFSAVAGYSAFGSYTGNGSTDGPFVFLGFRPRFVLFKRTDAANDWVIHDSSRNTFNVVDDFLKPNLSNAEGAYSTSGHGVDFLSSGMKLRTDSGQLNASTGTYIYACFAENPFKLSLAR